MTRARADEAVELELAGVAAGGGCVARMPDGRVVFVRHGLPGERVLARVTSDGSRFCRADAVSVLERSAQRVEPPCPHAGPGRCGGCDWQHASLAAQRAMKAELVREAFASLARLEVSVPVEAVGRADGLAWRSRVRFGVSSSGRVGLHRHRSAELELVGGCPIAAAGVESVGVERRRWPGAAEVEVFAPSSAVPLVSVTPRRRRVELPELGEEAPVLAVGRVAASRCTLAVDGAGRSFQVSGGAFWQVHVDAPGVLVQAVLEALEPAAGERAVDLHAGVGLFAVHLAHAVGPSGSVLAVERDPLACADAVANAAGLDRLEVRCASVDEQLVARLERPDLVVLDPPRAGLGVAAAAALAALEPPPRRVAYVACDATTLARDVRVLVERGFSLRSLRAFDLFPMTEHVELLALLEPAKR